MKKAAIVIIIVLLLSALGGTLIAWLVYRDGGSVQQLVIEQAVKNIVPTSVSPALVQTALGYHGKRTYLILFLNNTELRPGGGFIGAYGIVTMNNGLPTIEKIEGTENLDNGSSAAMPWVAPEPLTKYLRIKKWQFRDSNWSPDFPTSASTSLAFYGAEGGTDAGMIDGVIGFTPTILEELLKVTGPITVGDETFNALNATEKLEYAVEYGYAQKGYSFRDRKQTLVLLVQAVFDKVKFDLFKHWSQYLALAPQLLAHKQVMFYSIHPTEQTEIVKNGWAGDMKLTAGDYLLWADANLGALKTDAALERSLNYSLTPSSTGYVAMATMHYAHHGTFDWRTTRYLDYVRIFVPAGSTLISVTNGNENNPAKRVELIAQGEEGGRAWFGGFVHVEPGDEGTLTFTYRVAPSVAQSISSGNYQLLVQKQLGTIAPRLTLGLNFDKSLRSARPSEAADRYGDKRYDLITDLSVDRAVDVQF